MNFYATTPLGIESLLADEISGLGAEEVTPARAGVAFQGSLETAYRVCLWSRLANRVLRPILSFPAGTVEALYEGCRGVNWSLYLDPETLFAVDFASNRSALRHTLFGAQKVKDAIVDHFMEEQGSRPSVDVKDPDLRISVYLEKDQATLSLDFSGDSLHRRGYRLEGGKAPLKENLAAALLIRAGWPEISAQDGALIDPLCGSGTLPIEAAMMATDTAPGLSRRWFGFMAIPGYDPELWACLIDEARARAQKGQTRSLKIRGSDLDPRAISMARSNLERASLQGQVEFRVEALEAAEPSAPMGLLITNPPYGERLGETEALADLYRTLGDVLKSRFEGYRASVFTATPELAFKIGIRAQRQYALHNGALPCKLLNFEVTPKAYFTPHEGGPLSEEEIAQRRWSRRIKEVDLTTGGGEMVLNRLRKNHKNLGRWARQNEIECYRLYDADLPEYAVALDLYPCEGTLYAHLQEYAAPGSIDPKLAEQRLIEFIAAAGAALDLPEDRLILKVRRRQRGSEQYEKLGESGHFHLVREGGLKFRVNLEDYLDTGLFLDHRKTRELIRSFAPGARFLNLFSYTGSATVYAVSGGARSSLTIDLSSTYLAWAKANLELNGLGGESHQFLKADCLAWLADAADDQRFDLIFLDPPTFSTSKRMEATLDIQRDHVTLIRQCMKRLAPEGRLIFTCNQRKFRLDAEALSDFSLEDIGRKTLPKDFERNPKIHAGWIIRALSCP